MTRIMAEMAFREVHALCQGATGNGQDSMERLRKILQIVRDVDFRTHEMGENKAGRYRQALYFIANASHQTGDEIAKYAQERLVEIDDDLKETCPMTAPPKMPREPFTPPFSVDSYFASDCYYFTVKDAAGKPAADLDDLPSIKWLCDRLNAPTTQSGDERAAFEAAFAESCRLSVSFVRHTRRQDGGYHDGLTDKCWDMWQARAKHTSGPGGVSLTEEENDVLNDAEDYVGDLRILVGSDLVRDLLAIITRLQGRPS